MHWITTNSTSVLITTPIFSTGSGACGYNSACEMQNARPVCTCPPEFFLVNPLDRNGDCMPNFPQFCSGSETENGSLPQDNEYRLEMISDIDWPLNDYQKISPCSVEECQRACLDDCLCGVSIHRDNSCWKKKLPLSNGKSKKTPKVLRHFSSWGRRRTLLLLHSIRDQEKTTGKRWTLWYQCF